MLADFWAGYISGAIGILVGNPLDLIKTRVQAGLRTQPAENLTTSASTSTATSAPPPTQSSTPQRLHHWTSLARGAAAPILGYGALNALLFVTYNRSLALLNPAFPTIPGADTAATTTPLPPSPPAWWMIWTAGALGGLATFVVSAPTELVKCRAQVGPPGRSSAQVVRELWRAGGVRGLYMGGAVTSLRDAVGYGFYFWSYEVSKSWMMHDDDSTQQQNLKILLCGGLAGVATWVSIFPLDVIKTRVQTWDLLTKTTSIDPVARPLLGDDTTTRKTSETGMPKRPSSFAIAREAYRTEGAAVFFRGIGVCSARAFIVNAVQWAVYEWMMKVLAP